MFNDHRAVPLTIVSLGLMLVVASATSPLDNVGWVVAFLILMFVFLTGVISLAVQHKRGHLSRRAGTKAMLAALTLTAVVMLRSLQSLGLAETLLLLVLWGVMSFYITRASGGK